MPISPRPIAENLAADRTKPSLIPVPHRRHKQHCYRDNIRPRSEKNAINQTHPRWTRASFSGIQSFTFLQSDRSLIACVERLSSKIVEVQLDTSGENSIRLRVMTGE
jgi:hypothetical protein